VIKTLSVGL